MRELARPIGERVRALEVDMTELKERVDGGLQLMRQMNTSVNDLTRWQKAARLAEAEQYRKMQVRLQLLTVVIAIAAVCVPIVSALLHIS